ncbi:hypothetical protein AB0L40_21155 [Patulibacter sp. NPDC049589]|uniref:hypothetical protein n=1 Tax=Patulibacter sp. NPDC049589 TaxID=3154731 RepID=UPI003440BBFE
MSTPTHRTATPEDVGRSCPYCRFPLKPGAGVTDCGTCHATHHDDCWAEGGGCAVVGCGATSELDPTLVTSGAAAGASTGSVPIAPAPGSPPPAWAPPSGPPAPAPRRGNGLIVAAVLVLALVVAGSAAAFVLTRDAGDDAALAAQTTSTVGDTTSTAGDTSAEAPTATDTTSDTTTDDATPTATSGGAVPDDDESTMADDIATTISEYYGALNNGDTNTAWDLLSGRRHRLETSGRVLYGRQRTRASWAAAEGRTGLAVSPGTVTATMVELDRANGVATVRIKGLDFSGPNAGHCNGRYTGITWAKYENGAWKYEPGANTTAKREARWPNASTDPRLLGNKCN